MIENSVTFAAEFIKILNNKMKTIVDVMIDNLSKIYLSHKNVPTYDLINMFALTKQMEGAMILFIEQNGKTDKKTSDKFKEILQISEGNNHG